MNTLKVQKRDMETKAKRLRREGYVTGSLFGRGIEDSILLKIEKKEAERIQRECSKGSRIQLEVEGKAYDALLKEMNYDFMNSQILEMDFQALVKGEKVHSVAEITLQNKDKVVEGVLEQLLSEVSYTAKPKDLIDKVEIDCSTLRLGDTLKVSDLDIAKNENIEITTHLDALVLSVVAPRKETVEDEEAEESEE